MHVAKVKMNHSLLLRHCRIGMVASMAAVSLVAAACGGGGAPTSAGPLGPVALTAYKATVAGGSAKVASSFVFATGSGSSTETASGVFSWTSDLGEIASRTTSQGTELDTSEIIDGNDVYSRTSVAGSPNGRPAAAGGGTWSETTWSGNTGASVLTGLFFGSPGPPSPDVLLQLLHSQASSISNLGPKRIGGTWTTHYRALIPFSNLPGGKPSRVELREAKRIFGTTSLDIDFWVDSSQLLRKLAFTLTVHRLPPTKESSANALTFKLPITLAEALNVSDYGVPVEVTPPPPNEVSQGGTCQANANGFNCESSS
jgi:hypothetical protein